MTARRLAGTATPLPLSTVSSAYVAHLRCTWYFINNAMQTEQQQQRTCCALCQRSGYWLCRATVALAEYLHAQWVAYILALPAVPQCVRFTRGVRVAAG